jgi:hypothetical protein
LDHSGEPGFPVSKFAQQFCWIAWFRSTKLSEQLSTGDTPAWESSKNLIFIGGFCASEKSDMDGTEVARVFA